MQDKGVTSYQGGVGGASTGGTRVQRGGRVQMGGGSQGVKGVSMCRFLV